MCLTLEELENIKSVYNGQSLIMVGFNRRFAPLIKKLFDFLKKENNPKTFIYNCNAGYIDKNSWVQDESVSGGRLIGECCHLLIW